MEVEYFRARSQTHHLAVVRLIIVLSCHCGRNRGECCKRRCRSMSSSSKVTVDEDPGLVNKLKCRNNFKKRLDSLLATYTSRSRLSSENAAPRSTVSKNGAYLPCWICLILLHMFARCLIALWISTSLRSRQAYCICIELITAIVLRPHKTLLHPLPDLWLSLYVKFVPYMNCGFSLDTDPWSSSWGTDTSARSNEWDMTAEHGFSCLCDELKCSVDESGHLDDAKQIAT